MTKTMSQFVEEEKESGRLSTKIMLLFAGGLVAFIFSIVGSVIINTGGRIVTGGETAAVLSAQMTQFVKVNEEQNKKLDDGNRLSQEMLVRMGSFYTREDARADRAATDERFRRMELAITDIGKQVGDTGRRLDFLEASVRLQQGVIDKFIAAGPKR